MSEWEEKLNTLLSDPDAMAQVMNMAQICRSRWGSPAAARRLLRPRAVRPVLRRRLPLHHRRRAIRWAIFRRCSAALTPA